MPSRPPYSGISRKLVLAFDIGTTFSGISYSFLIPGCVPEIKGVTRFPSQAHVGGDSKIPTIIFYNDNGEACAMGAQTVQEESVEMAEIHGWSKAEWFKLHMSPKSASDSTKHRIPQLPPNKTVVDIFSDFMHYLFECAKEYICDTHPNSTALWASVERKIEFVLSHPNGWGGPEQVKMRTAAVLAGLIPDTNEGHARICFVTEGEASLHCCIQQGLTTEVIQDGEGVLIVDAGGGTIDLSAYATGDTKLSFQEIAATECHFQGSIFVTRHARNFLQAHLSSSKFISDVEHISYEFDKMTKLRFKSTGDMQYIKFGSVRDSDPEVGIQAGQLKLPGHIVAKFFEPSIACIMSAIENQCDKAAKEIKAVFLVGGFAASNWLFSQLKNQLEPLGLDVCRPDSHLNKAVADGAVSFFLDRFVKMRVSKYAYGVVQDIPFDETDMEHLVRSSSRFCDASGQVCLHNSFSVILPKNVQVYDVQEFRRSYWEDRATPSGFGAELKNDIVRYEGSAVEPRWTDMDNESFVPLCTVVVPIAQIAHLIQPRTDWGQHFYRLAYDIVLSFGLTELTAQLAWVEYGRQRRCPAKIVYDYVAP